MLHLLHPLFLALLCSIYPQQAARPQQAADAPTSASVELQPLTRDGEIVAAARGLWRSRGYGWIADFRGAGAVVYDHNRFATQRLDAEWDEYFSDMLWCKRGDALVVTPSADAVTAYTLDPIRALPENVDSPPGADPLSVFDYFWECMNAHYAFFHLYDVDWQARRETYRPRISADMGERELFDVLGQTLTGIEDAHLELSAEIDGRQVKHALGDARVLAPALAERFEQQAEIPSMEAYRNHWARLYKDRVARIVLGMQFQLEADGRIVWGRIGRIGYVNILAMAGYSDDDDIRAEVRNADEAMSNVVRGLADCDGMIVDITMNSGGYDDVQLAFATHFTDERTLAFTKYPADAESVEPQAVHLAPAQGPRFTKPVSLVTSDFTVSAGESFTMAMRSIPTVVHRGMTTRGALSDMLEKRLPNGWLLYLSNEVYLDHEGNHWEARGVPPHEAIAVFDPADLDESHPRAILTIADKMMRGE